MDVIIQESWANEDLCLPAYSIPVSILCNHPQFLGTDFEARLTEFCHFLCEFKQLTSPLSASLMTRTLMNTDFTCCSEGQR